MGHRRRYDIGRRCSTHSGPCHVPISPSLAPELPASPPLTPSPGAAYRVTVLERHRYAAMETSFANGGQLSASNAEVWNSRATVLKGLRWMFTRDAPLLHESAAKLAQVLVDRRVPAPDSELSREHDRNRAARALPPASICSRSRSASASISTLSDAASCISTPPVRNSMPRRRSMHCYVKAALTGAR